MQNRRSICTGSTSSGRDARPCRASSRSRCQTAARNPARRFVARGAMKVAAVRLANADGRSILDNGLDDRKRMLLLAIWSRTPARRPARYACLSTHQRASCAVRSSAMTRLCPSGNKQVQQFESLLRPKGYARPAREWPRDEAPTNCRRHGDRRNLVSLTSVKGTEARKKKPASPTERDRPVVPKKAVT
jgi:hypothetical protein